MPLQCVSPKLQGSVKAEDLLFAQQHPPVNGESPLPSRTSRSNDGALDAEALIVHSISVALVATDRDARSAARPPPPIDECVECGDDALDGFGDGDEEDEDDDNWCNAVSGDASSPSHMLQELTEASSAQQTTLVSGSSSASAEPPGAKKGAGSETDRMRRHWDDANKAHSDFRCNCALSSAQGLDSCLHRGFDITTFRTLHRTTYGDTPPQAVPHLQEVSTSVHRQIWKLRRALPEMNNHLHTMHVPEWRLNNGREDITVCKAAFIRAVGGSANLHRTRLAAVLRGYSPEAMTSSQLSTINSQVLKHDRAAASERKQFTISWWTRHLRLQDYMPNENMIQYPYWEEVWESWYKPDCKRSSLMHLSRKQWKLCSRPALQRLARDLPQCSDPSKLRLGRSPRHSHFPECNTCHRLRTVGIKLARDMGSSQEARDKNHQERLAHNEEWSADRNVALEMKYESYREDCPYVYEGDDKQGSHWSTFPVDAAGRDSKDTSKAKLPFSVQANVFCGPNGKIRVSLAILIYLEPRGHSHPETDRSFGVIRDRLV